MSQQVKKLTKREFMKLPKAERDRILDELRAKLKEQRGRDDIYFTPN